MLGMTAMTEIQTKYIGTCQGQTLNHGAVG
jgi:hypothetical protein